MICTRSRTYCLTDPRSPRRAALHMYGTRAVGHRAPRTRGTEPSDKWNRCRRLDACCACSSSWQLAPFLHPTQKIEAAPRCRRPRHGNHNAREVRVRPQHDARCRAGERTCRDRERQRQVARAEQKCAGEPRQAAVLHGYFSFDDPAAARLKVSAADAGPWLNVPASSVPSALMVAEYEPATGAMASVTVAPFSVIATGSSRPP